GGGRARPRRSAQRRRGQRRRARRGRRARRRARRRRGALILLEHLHRPRHLEREQAEQENAAGGGDHLLPPGLGFGVGLLFRHQLVPPAPGAAVAPGVVGVGLVVVVVGEVVVGVVEPGVVVDPGAPVAPAAACGGALTVAPLP